MSTLQSTVQALINAPQKPEWLTPCDLNIESKYLDWESAFFIRNNYSVENKNRKFFYDYLMPIAWELDKVLPGWQEILNPTSNA